MFLGCAGGAACVTLPGQRGFTGGGRSRSRWGEAPTNPTNESSQPTDAAAECYTGAGALQTSIRYW
jgi:hypothetical protein